jgi:hypothetical protein
VVSLDEEKTSKDLHSFSTLKKWTYHDAFDKSYDDCKEITNLLLQRMIDQQLRIHQAAHLVSKRNDIPVFLANEITSFVDAPPPLPANVRAKLAEVRGNDGVDTWERRLRSWTVHSHRRGGRKQTRRSCSKKATKQSRTKRRKP